MDPKVEAVLAEYEHREADEHAREAAGEKIPVDDLLITIGRPAGTFLGVLIREMKAKTIIELGTSYGNSTIWLAEAARDSGGRVISFDIAGYKQEFAQKMLERAGLREFVDLRTADALIELERMPGHFDFVLLDIWKDLYIPCLDRFYPKLSPGALIAAGKPGRILRTGFVPRESLRATQRHVSRRRKKLALHQARPRQCE